jgi:hypothetical protein
VPTGTDKGFGNIPPNHTILKVILNFRGLGFRELDPDSTQKIAQPDMCMFL